MKIVVLKDLPWDTSRGDVAAAVRLWSHPGFFGEDMVLAEYGRHVIFANRSGQFCCILLVPGNGNVDADRRPPYLLIDIGPEPDPSCDESQFSYAMQDEVRSIRNTIGRLVKERNIRMRVADALMIAFRKEPTLAPAHH